jgi:hypothetical protein
MIKVKYSALVEIKFEVSEQVSGVMSFEEIAKRFDGGRFMDAGVRHCIAEGFNTVGLTVKVARQNAELWREDI